MSNYDIFLLDEKFLLKGDTYEKNWDYRNNTS